MSEFDKIADLVNSMTSEQYIAFITSFDGEVPADIAVLSDDELLAELGA